MGLKESITESVINVLDMMPATFLGAVVALLFTQKDITNSGRFVALLIAAGCTFVLDVLAKRVKNQWTDSMKGNISNGYQFFMKTNIDNYFGEWIAICDQKIVSHGKNVKRVFDEAKRTCPKEMPLMARVPDKETMIFLLLK